MEQNEFARHAGIPIPTMKKWVGAKEPAIRPANRERLARGLGVPRMEIDAALDGAQAIVAPPVVEQPFRIGEFVAGGKKRKTAVREVPIINRIAAGPLTEVTDLDYPAGFSDGHVALAMDEGTQAFGMWVDGESMLPRYEPGDLVVFRVVREGETIIEGKDYAIQTEEHGDVKSTFKRVAYHPRVKNVLVATALNPEFKPRTMEIPLERVTRLGHVMVIIPGNK